MLAVAATVHFSPRDAHAQSPVGVFGYAFQGLGVGAPIGLSASYLLTRDGSWGTEDWQDLGLGAGIGAISGAVGGLAIGLADMQDGQAGLGAIVLRDTWYGTLLGATVGAIVGAVRLMNSGNGEDVLVSMAWGAVIGAPVGVGVGFAEAAITDERANSTPHHYAHAVNAPKQNGPAAWRFAVIPVNASGVQSRWGLMPTLSGTF